MTWKTKLTNIYDLASLHSWINQIDEMIIKFIEDNVEHDEIVKYLIEDMKSEHFTTEHNIISLIVLNYFDYPVLKIIDLANEKLYGKISRNDIDFLKKHLFSGNFPLSSDLSYDITNRSFLSPKKAIKKAMQIDTVISKENPHLTVLYMCFIISRMDMNEENRAMVAFLLLRIDIDLPQGLQQRVFKYLWEYKDIIQELLEEESDGPVILENIKNIKEKISSIQIIEAKKESNLEADVINTQSPDIKTIINKNIPDIEVRKKSIKNTHIKKFESPSFTNEPDNNHVPVSNKNKTLEKAVESNINKKQYTNTFKLPNNKKEVQSVLNSKKMASPLTVIQKSPLTHKYENKDNFGGINEPNVPYKKDSNYTDLVSNVEKSKPNENIEKENESKNKKLDPLDKKSWSINLRENRDILKSILNGIFQKSSSTKNHHKKTNNTSIKSQKSKNKISNPKRSNIIKHKKLFILFGFLIFIGLSIYFIVGGNTNHNTIKKNIINKSVSVVPGINNSDNPTSQSNAPILNETKTSGNIVSKIPSDFPYNISVEGNNLSWKVAKGDSITGLFYALKDYKTKLVGSSLEKLSNMNWEIFFADFKKNNPKRASYHIIFPSETFILSLD